MEEAKRILGLDIGTKRTGVAVSDATHFLGSPLTTIETRDMREMVSQVSEIVKEEDIGEIVVGLPLDQYGEEGVDAQRIRKVIDQLRGKVEVPVVEWDERFTTVQAERQLIAADVSREKRKKVIDRMVAAIILQGYLDSRRPASTSYDDYSE